MSMTRRVFLQAGAAGLAGAVLARELTAAAGGGGAPRVRISGRGSSYGGKYEIAKLCGLEGVEIGVGGPAEKLSIANPEARQKIKEQTKEAGLVVSSLSMDLLNGNPMASDPQAPAWVEQCIEAAKDLGAVGILVPFFGKGGLLDKGKELKKDDVATLVERMKKLGPVAKAAGVTLGLENTCSARQNLEILDRIGCEGVGVYYDIGNSTGGGYDVPAEIRELKGRMSMIHFKDGGNYLGEGKVKMEPVAAALKDIGYAGWIVLETGCPSKNPEADCKRNVDCIRRVMGLA